MPEEPDYDFVEEEIDDDFLEDDFEESQSLSEILPNNANRGI